MSKKITIMSKPVKTKQADEWVATRDTVPVPTASEPMKRLTVDIPAGLHAKMKSDCAMQGRKMADAIRELLHDAFSNNNKS